MSLKKLAIAVLVLLGVGGLLAYQLRGRSGVETADGGLPKTLTIASIAYPYKGQQTYAGLTQRIIEQGWLKEQLAKKGVELAFFPVPTAVGGPLINEGFAGKRIDFASYGDFPAIIAASGGVPLKLVVPVGRGQNAYLIVRKGLTANSIADLKGKRIALHRGRPWELPFSKLLDENGLKLADFKILNINPPASHAALASGDVDAVFLLSDAILLEQKGAGRIIWSTKTAPSDWKMRAELFARGDFVDRHPELTQLVADAYIRAAHWSSQPENRAAVIDEAARGDTPVSVVEKDYDEPRVTWRDRFSPLFDDFMVRHYRSVADYTFAQGLVRQKVDVDTLLDRRFAAQALKNLGLEDYWQPTATDSADAKKPGAPRS
ncbi:nitrate ABC transporter substrate-binding protein [Sphingomonas sp. DBB INV C78]|uniref:ABC transporter substrate-binding protein n=1 Tax=Sphingomonas sp. DBB INV C78 TaxID=3349434 RepID=UPI0036D3282C